jgi:hypothetical protein
MKTFMLLAMLTAPVSAFAEGGWEFFAYRTGNGETVHTQPFIDKMSTIENKMDCLEYAGYVHAKLIAEGTVDNYILKCKPL